MAREGMTSANISINSTFSPIEPHFMFDFERQFQPEEKILWFTNNWSLSVVSSIVYITLLFLGRIYMASRTAYDLRMALSIWSTSLAVFSWVGAARVAASCLQVIRKYGLHTFACDPGLYKGASGFWLWAFTLSKLPELGDTAFIVLRKQNLMFLHWYHHVTVLMYSWYSYPQILSLALLFCLMNFVVHSLMYTYYALKASRFVRIPNSVSLVITSLQIVQMFIGCVANGYASWVISSGGYCASNVRNMQVSTAMYFSYLVLFCHFFYGRYVSKQPFSGAKKLK